MCEWSNPGFFGVFSNKLVVKQSSRNNHQKQNKLTQPKEREKRKFFKKFVYFVCETRAKWENSLITAVIAIFPAEVWNL